MILQPRVRKIIREIAEETGLSFNQVRDIALASQFKFVVENMAKGVKGEPDTFKNIILRFFGTFKSSPGKIIHSTKAAQRKREREESDEKHN